MLEGGELVEDTTETPDVGLLVIGLLLADFGREVVGGTDGGLSAIVSVLKNSGYGN